MFMSCPLSPNGDVLTQPARNRGGNSLSILVRAANDPFSLPRLEAGARGVGSVHAIHEGGQDVHILTPLMIDRFS